MKKVAAGLISLIVGCFVFFLGTSSKNNFIPNYVYQVYLDDQVIGVVQSKIELEKYIDKKESALKDKYSVDDVHIPNGLEVRKVITYSNESDSISDIYDKIAKLRSFTVDGYQYTIKRQVEDEEGNKKEESIHIYTIDEKIFDESIYNIVKAFVGEENLKNFQNDTQQKIVDTGSTYSDIYVDNDITHKQVRISSDEHIFTDSDELSQYLLFSNTKQRDKYIVKTGDTITSVSKKNKINVDEFLISNPEFTSKDNMLYPGQIVVVDYPNPIIDVVSNVIDIRDEISHYKVEEHENENLNMGYEKVIQEGEDGINRVTNKILYRNGNIEGTVSLNVQEIKPTVTKIIDIGTKYVSGVGGKYYSMPTRGMVSAVFGQIRYSAARHGRYPHTGVDISGAPWTPIYAANNGVVTMLTSSYGSYGLFIAINHNNGTGTAYGHLNAFAAGLRVGSVVERGQLIGYMGNTGGSSGDHLHFEAYYGGSHPGYDYSRFFCAGILQGINNYSMCS